MQAGRSILNAGRSSSYQYMYSAALPPCHPLPVTTSSQLQRATCKMGNAPAPGHYHLINLMRGWPNATLLPVELLREAANHALSDPSIAHDGLFYGPDPGYEPARRAIAKWLTTFYQPSIPITASRLNITGGASQNLGCILQVYTDPEYTCNVWIVSPAYMLAFRIFEDAGFAGRMRSVPEDEEGLDIAFLRHEIKKSEKCARKRDVNGPKYKGQRRGAKVYKHVIYCVPTFANPSSRTMSLARRQGLVRLARDFDALVVPDDVYDFLQWSTNPEATNHSQSAHLPRLVDIDREIDGGAEREGADGFGNTCSNGSFSKIAGPGLRCGWVEGTEKFAYGMSQCGTTASGGAPSQLTSTYLTHLLETNQIQTHINTVLQPAYASRYNLLIRAIEAHLLPLGFKLAQPGRDVVGGYFVWLSLPRGVTAPELAQRCKEDQELIIAPGPIFEVPGDRTPIHFDGHVRLCFAYVPEEDLVQGVARMSVVAQEMLDEQRRVLTSGVGPPDPMIGMLARKASASADLKELMKVVAGGTASQDDLKKFQRHVDTLKAERASIGSAEEFK
ncbi:aminotransferase like protein [Teratosphaeria destructans]|uniref:Aminotransferase like protein n=1 Tax=Teratosphaeria destructans TaxID=418781 RepID=A0A9W7SRY9_9PEZI|nr:aminotransferase like protein [Teratosphaeria destructans]